MKIVDVSTRRRVTVVMFTLAVVLFGAVSFSRLKVNLLPDLSYPTLTVRTEYPGAAPAEVENLISKPIEEALGVVRNVTRVSSISRAGQSDVVLEFDWGTDMDYAGLDVREKLDVLELPLEVRRPSVLRFDPSLDPIMRFALVREAAPAAAGGPAEAERLESEQLKSLRRFAEEELKKELESAKGVAAVKVSGGLEDEIQVLIDQARATQLKIPVDDLVRLLGAENVNLSGGRLEEGTRQYLVRTLNQFQSTAEIGEVIVTYRDGKPIYLKDVATVVEGHKERDAVTRLGGAEAVEIAIYKEGDANTVSVGREVEKQLRRAKAGLPRELKVVQVYDQSRFIRQSVNEVISAAIIGGLLAILVLYFFLENIWATVIISLSIPISVIATFNLMYGTDLTLNIMSLGGIALGVGMLVDNSIVVLENVARHKQAGEDGPTAARFGASEVGTAVSASTLTTVAVFFPLVFVRGVAGQLFRDQALTVTFALLASLVVAMTLVPMLAALERRRTAGVPAGSGSPDPQEPSCDGARPEGGRAGRRRWLRVLSALGARFRCALLLRAPVAALRALGRVYGVLSMVLYRAMRPAVSRFQRWYARVEAIYPRLILWALGHRRTVVLASLALLAASAALVPLLGVELIPQLHQGEFRVELRLPPGTSLETTDEVLREVQAEAVRLPEVAACFSVAGTGNRMDANPDQGGENWGQLDVTLRPGSGRSGEEAVMAALRERMSGIPGLQHKMSRSTLFTFRTPVEIEVAGYDLARLKQASGAIVQRMQRSERFADVKSTMESGHPEIQIRFDRERAAALGLAVYEIADRVVEKVRGEVATRYSRHDRKIDVLVRARDEDRSSVEQIRSLVVNPESDRPVTLESVADITVDTGPSEIRRVDQERVAMITANLRRGDLGGAAEEINSIVGQIDKPADIGVRLAGQSEEMAVSFRSLQLALLLAVFLVYLVMASQFESFLHPFVILLTIPLALVGAVLALAVTGSTISVVVLIGVILLAGIVVNNAIVLISLVNQLRARGTPKVQALAEAGRMRLRPILMTTVTTVLGLLPLALGLGEGAEIRAPMAITVIGGLTVSTLLTLVVIPVVYASLDRKD